MYNGAHTGKRELQRRWGIKFPKRVILISITAGVALLAAGMYESVPTEDPLSATPLSPNFSQVILDCRTTAAVAPGQPIQPPPGCDDWERNRYERPFNPTGQDVYFADLDILAGELGQAGDWYYVRIALSGLREASTHPDGAYAVEIDSDLDGRGDLLILAASPGSSGGVDWSAGGMQVWEDSNRDVGASTPAQPDSTSSSDGYDHLIFDGEASRNPDLAWSRFIPGPTAIVELAFDRALFSDPSQFKWRLWAADHLDPALMDFHDTVPRSHAGDAYAFQPNYPSNELHHLDSTCTGYWPGLDNDDPNLCLHDPFIPVAGEPAFPPQRSPTGLPSSLPAIPSATITATPGAISPSATFSPTIQPTATFYPTATWPPTATHRPIRPTATPPPIPPSPTMTETQRGCDPIYGCATPVPTNTDVCTPLPAGGGCD